MPTPYATPRTLPALALAGVTCLLSACAPVSVQPPASAQVSAAAEAAPTATPCPKDLAPIARFIVARRAEQPIVRTAQLAEAMAKAH